MPPIWNFAKFIIDTIDRVIVPLVFAIAFIVFIIGVFQYFIAGGADEEKRKQGKDFIVYSLIGFFLMISIWGIVNLLVGTFGFGGAARPAIPTFNGAGGANNFGGNVGLGGACPTGNECRSGLTCDLTRHQCTNPSQGGALSCSPGSELSQEGESPSACCARAFGAGYVFNSSTGCVPGS